MDSIINSVSGLFNTYGIKVACLILAVVVIVNLIKRPLIKLAERLMVERGYDKSVVTAWVTYIPFVVAFILVFCYDLIVAKFHIAALDFAQISANAVTYGGAATVIYNAIKHHLEAYVSKKTADAQIKEAEIQYAEFAEAQETQAQETQTEQTEHSSEEDNHDEEVL